MFEDPIFAQCRPRLCCVQ